MALPFVVRALIEQEIRRLRANAALLHAASAVGSIRIKLEGFDDLKKRLDSFPSALRKKYMRNGMRALVAEMRKGARRRVPSRTGALRRSMGISTRLLPDGAVQGKVFTGAAIGAGKLKGSDAWYGHLVERGTRPHVIRARSGRGLSVGGKVFKEVRHPGIRGRYFIRRTAQEDFGRANQLFNDYVLSRSKEHIEGR